MRQCICFSMPPRSTWCKSFPMRVNCRSYRIPFASLRMPANPLFLLPFRNVTHTISFKPFLSALTFYYFASLMTFPHLFNAEAVWLIREVKELHICGLWWLYYSYQSFLTAGQFTQHLYFERRKENCNNFLGGEIFSFLLETYSQLWALCH